MPSPVLQARARLGVAARTRDPLAIRKAQRDLAAAKIAAYVQRTIDAAPPLTTEQRERIARLLTPAGGGRLA